MFIIINHTNGNIPFLTLHDVILYLMNSCSIFDFDNDYRTHRSFYDLTGGLYKPSLVGTYYE